MNDKFPSRRKFLKLGIAAGAGALILGGNKVFSSFTDTDSKETGEKVKLLTPDGKLVEVDKGTCVVPCHRPASPRRNAGKKMVMVIDLAKCRNARKCLEGCQKMHHLPPHMEWIKFYLMRDKPGYSALLVPETLPALQQPALCQGLPGRCHIQTHRRDRADRQ